MSTTNPFYPSDTDRHYIWEMLVTRDVTAFCNQDWDQISDDFIELNFMGIDCQGRSNPDAWKITFDSLNAYKNEWLKQAHEFSMNDWSDDPQEELLQIITLLDIDIKGESALIHKKFDGHIRKSDGCDEYLNWQTIYRCRKVNGQWKIAGFTGYMPYPLGATLSIESGIKAPSNASQHKTAGPYSPVLEVTPGKIVVISGQAAIDDEGTVVGDTIEEQTAFTLSNCRKQLTAAGCDLNDVFKVNVFLTDLKNWPRFNKVYKTYFNDPKPVRTAVQTPLLYNFLVEIEMWALKK